MDITLQYFDGCPNWTIAEERLAVLAEQNPGIVVTHQLVHTVDEAQRVRFHGSPSVLIDGVDPFVEPEPAIGLACRRYLTPDGYAGAPTMEQLRAVVLAARDSGPTEPGTGTMTDPSNRFLTGG